MGLTWGESTDYCSNDSPPTVGCLSAGCLAIRELLWILGKLSFDPGTMGRGGRLDPPAGILVDENSSGHVSSGDHDVRGLCSSAAE
jgi:hypothetical protein